MTDNAWGTPWGQWVALDTVAVQDYLNGYLTPLAVEETEDGVLAYMPHDYPERTFIGGQRICTKCRLLPLDYDSLEYPCET